MARRSVILGTAFVSTASIADVQATTGATGVGDVVTYGVASARPSTMQPTTLPPSDSGSRTVSTTVRRGSLTLRYTPRKIGSDELTTS